MTSQVKRLPELLCPAGDMEKLRLALHFGADAVYLAGREFGMRVGAGNFEDRELIRAVELCHSMGKKAYVTVNNLLRCGELERLPAFLEVVGEAGADAVIAADLGVMKIVKKRLPEIRLHASTQVGILNHETADMLFSLGASRAILARELSLGEIADIRARCPRELELEAFVHGAMCVSYSGRCLLSEYLTGRDPNRGECSGPCRWKYFLMEEKRPGQYFEIFEDGGTHIMNAKDLCMAGHLHELTQAGVSSLKIEGRAKSSYYAAVTAYAYRCALGDMLKGMPARDLCFEELSKISHRPYCTGFYFPDGGETQHTEDSGYIREWDIIAIVLSRGSGGLCTLLQKNRFSRGDEAELLSPGRTPEKIIIGELFDADGLPVACAAHPHMTVTTRLPKGANELSILRRKAE